MNVALALSCSSTVNAVGLFSVALDVAILVTVAIATVRQFPSRNASNNGAVDAAQAFALVLVLLFNGALFPWRVSLVLDTVTLALWMQR